MTNYSVPVFVTNKFLTKCDGKTNKYHTRKNYVKTSLLIVRKVGGERGAREQHGGERY